MVGIPALEMVKFISTNSQGDDFSSLVGLVKSKDIGIFTVQETKSRRKGKFGLENYIIFETIRNKIGGGTMMGVHASLIQI